MTQVDIHSDLRLEARFTMAVGVVLLVAGMLFIFWGGGLLAFSAGLFQEFIPLESPPPVIGWLVIIVCLLAGFALLSYGRHLLFEYPGWLRRASWLLAHTQPRRMLMTFQQKEGVPGNKVELREEGKAETSLADETLEIRSPQWKLRDSAPQLVSVFGEPTPDGMLVILTNYGVLWGLREQKGLML